MHMTVADPERSSALRILPMMLCGESLPLEAVMRPGSPTSMRRRTQRAEVYHIYRLYGGLFGGKTSFCCTYQEAIIRILGTPCAWPRLVGAHGRGCRVLRAKTANGSNACEG